jgi:methionine-rich copper-binding protein CopC
MKTPRIIAAFFAIAASLLLVGWTAFHLELWDSFPDDGEALTEAPTEIWLEFSVVPDMEQTSFSVRGPDGNVTLSDMSAGESPEIVRADVEGTMPPGEYTLSWVGAPMDDHTVRGRFGFSVGAPR